MGGAGIIFSTVLHIILRISYEFQEDNRWQCVLKVIAVLRGLHTKCFVLHARQFHTVQSVQSVIFISIQRKVNGTNLKYDFLEISTKMVFYREYAKRKILWDFQVGLKYDFLEFSTKKVFQPGISEKKDSVRFPIRSYLNSFQIFV